MRELSESFAVHGCVACSDSPSLPDELVELERTVGVKQRELLFDPGSTGLRRSIGIGTSDNETVIGPTDSLNFVDDSRIAPWSMICRLECRFPDYDPNDPDHGSVVGTGWFAGNQTVITAGHCIYDRSKGGWAERISVTQGYIEGSPAPDRTEIVTESFSALRKWVELSSEDHDLGCIHLEKSLGSLSAKRSYAALKDSFLENQQVYCAGYPRYGATGIRRIDEKPRNGQRMFVASDVIADLTSGRIFHSVDTFKGMSGGPIWRAGDDSEDPPVIVGIHTDGIDRTGTGPEKKLNAAVRINAEIFRKIQAWESQKGGVENLEDVSGLRSMDRRNHRNSLVAGVARQTLESATPIPVSPATNVVQTLASPRVPPAEFAWVPWAGASLLLVAYLGITIWMMWLAGTAEMKEDAIWRRLTDIHDGFLPVAIAAVGFLLGVQIQDRRTANAMSDANAARELATEADKRANETEARGQALREMVDDTVAAQSNESSGNAMSPASFAKVVRAAFPPR